MGNLRSFKRGIKHDCLVRAKEKEKQRLELAKNKAIEKERNDAEFINNAIKVATEIRENCHKVNEIMSSK